MKTPDLDKWAIHVRRMRDLDNRKPDKIANMINLIFDDNRIWDGTFWRSNIMSTKKLRDQYDKIAIQINNSMKKAG